MGGEGGGVRYVLRSGWEGWVGLDMCGGTDDPLVCNSYHQSSIVVAKIIMCVGGRSGV